MMRVMHVIGARPQFIKAAPLLAAMQRAADVEPSLVHTGQHFDADMSDVFFDELGLPRPDHLLEISGGGHGDMTGRMMIALEPVVEAARPDWMLIYGDTNSTLAAALVAAKLHVPVAHVEAGLRSFNRTMPEEVNRVVADHVSSLCLAPTDAAMANLAAEGVDAGRIVRTGDVMFDAVKLFGPIARSRSVLLDELDLPADGFVLATLHRAENTDHPARLRTAIEALVEVAADLPVVLPLHPRTEGALEAAAVDTGPIRRLPPVGYLDMLALEATAAVIVTDSGGVQKEAFFHRRPCVTLRDETEWVELVELGWNRLAPPVDASEVVAVIRSALGSEGADAEPYGDGRASEEIIRALLDVDPNP